MSIKNLERAVRRLEKNLPPLPGELFPFIDHLIAQHPNLSLELPTRPFTTARCVARECVHCTTHTPLPLKRPPNHCSLPTVHCQLFTAHAHPQVGRSRPSAGGSFTDLFNNLIYHDDWSPIRHALDARWPRLRWALAGKDPFYQAQGYHDCLDLLACIVWQKSTDPYTYYFTHPTPEEELAIYRQYRQLPSPQRRQYRHDALEDAALYYDPTPGQRQIFLNILAELNK